jgi:hypothetical protein
MNSFVEDVKDDGTWDNLHDIYAYLTELRYDLDHLDSGMDDIKLELKEAISVIQARIKELEIYKEN